MDRGSCQVSQPEPKILHNIPRCRIDIHFSPALAWAYVTLYYSPPPTWQTYSPSSSSLGIDAACARANVGNGLRTERGRDGGRDTGPTIPRPRNIITRWIWHLGEAPLPRGCTAPAHALPIQSTYTTTHIGSTNVLEAGSPAAANDGGLGISQAIQHP